MSVGVDLQDPNFFGFPLKVQALKILPKYSTGLLFKVRRMKKRTIIAIIENLTNFK